MQNKHSTDGLAEDLIRSMLQMACAEMHVKTLIEKAQSEVENGTVNTDDTEELLTALDGISSLEKDLTSYAQLRREDMLMLYEMYGSKGDKTQWCMVKHLGIASMTAFEAYQASDEDPELFNNYTRKNREFIKSLSAFLGVGITDCAACFADMLKGEHE